LTADRRLHEELATATRILGRHDMIGLFGHVSVLTDDPERYLICPGAGTRKDLCRADEVIELHLDDEFAPGLPLELYMHAEAHRARPETIRSLVHVHSPALTALSMLAEIPGELLMLHASFWPQRMPIFDEPELVRDRRRGERLLEVIGDEALALLRWHGAVIVGTTLEEAVYRTLLAEQHAQHVLTALSHGRPLAPVPVGSSRPDLYQRLAGAWVHKVQWRYEASYVPEPPGAILGAAPPPLSGSHP
jgi:ribulose-5-phosphate 4-epimerase/fuculose-1-phosphate aldolase